MKKQTQPKSQKSIEKAVAAKGAKPITDAEAVEWIKFHLKQATGAKRVPGQAFKKFPSSKEGIGRMYFFAYDPKWKDKLPYYDMFPLVIPIEQYTDGFLGLNLHYLPPIARARLLDNLMNVTRKSGTEQAYMALSYQLLSSVAKVKGYDRCIKRYLTSHIKSSLIRVSEDYWEEACLLPVQEFRKESTPKIWGKRR